MKSKLNIMAETLFVCFEQFKSYEQQHLAKVPPDTKKATTNGLLKDMCDRTLRECGYNPEVMKIT